MKISRYILIIVVLGSGCELKESNNETESMTYSIRSTKDYTPMSFIKAAQINSQLNLFETHNDFSQNWVKTDDIDSLISIIDSKEKCNCYYNPLGSYIPNDSAEVGGFAIEFIKAFKENRKVDLGLYTCPKVDKKAAEDLKMWWKKQSRE